ncbi:hypothetical protein JCM10213v2_003765 [Rhodosporidiobolus nylandii]
MSRTETGQCCVCGKETDQRCGACETVDTSLFFCSRDHQKLIWFAHKRVCGKPGFEHPRLTAEEASYAEANRLETAITFKGGQRYTFPEFLHEYFRLPLNSDRADVLVAQLVLSRLAEGADSPYPPDLIQMLLQSVRYAAETARLSQKDDPGAYPFERVASFTLNLQTRSLPTPDAGWFAVFQHQLLVVFALRAAEVKHGESSTLIAYRKQAINRLCAMAVDVPRSDKGGEAVSEAVRTLLSDWFGVEWFDSRGGGQAEQ